MFVLLSGRLICHSFAISLQVYSHDNSTLFRSDPLHPAFMGGNPGGSKASSAGKPACDHSPASLAGCVTRPSIINQPIFN